MLTPALHAVVLYAGLCVCLWVLQLPAARTKLVTQFDRSAAEWGQVQLLWIRLALYIYVFVFTKSTNYFYDLYRTYIIVAVLST